MDSPRPRAAPKPPPEGWPTTAVGFQRQQRKAKRVVTIVALTFIVGPFALVALGFVIAAIGSGSGWALLGIPFMMLGALISVAMPLLVVALFVWAAWAIVTQYYRKPTTPEQAPAPAVRAPAGLASLAAPHAAELALLDELRAGLAREARWRTLIFVPLGIAAAMLLFYVMTRGGGQTSGSPTMAFVIMTVIGGGGAWLWAVSGPRQRYALAFKAQLLPRLLSSYGELTHELGGKPDLGRAITAGFLPAADLVEADDAFAGSYRGRAVRMTELTVKRKGQGDADDETLFAGLYVEITVSTPFRGTTILRDRDEPQPSTSLQRLRLEDPVFEDIYAAWASDQIEGRAVLTPAVMERLLVMADGHAFLPPRFLLDGDRMVFALPTITPGSLFEPPGLETHVAAQQLASLEADLATVFNLADAMIDMHVAVRAPQDRSVELGFPTRTSTP